MSEPTFQPDSPPTTPSELDALAVLWEAKAEGIPLRLSQVHERVCARRARLGELSPALTTVSTNLRSLLAKGILREVVVKTTADGVQAAVRSRGMLSPSTRSPLTGYEAVKDVAEVLRPTFQALAQVYPPDRRHEALLDFARAIDLSPDQIKSAVKEIQKLARDGPKEPRP